MVSELIKRIMERCRLEQRDLADLSGISLQRIKDLSSGRVRDFKTSEINALVSKLHLNSEWLTSYGNGPMFQEWFWDQSPTVHVGEILNRMAAATGKSTIGVSRADLFGVSQGELEKWMKRGMVPGHFLVRFAKAHGKTPGFLLFGVNDTVEAYSRTNEPQRTAIKEEPPRYADNVRIPQYDVKAAAGHGNLIHEENVVGYMDIQRSLLRNTLGCEPGKVGMIRVDGPSMAPTLLDGEWVLVDLRCDRFNDDDVYVLQFDGRLRIKRLQLHLDGSVLIKSDNPEFPPHVVAAEQADLLRIIGKVRPWKFGMFKL